MRDNSSIKNSSLPDLTQTGRNKFSEDQAKIVKIPEGFTTRGSQKEAAMSPSKHEGLIL